MKKLDPRGSQGCIGSICGSLLGIVWNHFEKIYLHLPRNPSRSRLHSPTKPLKGPCRRVIGPKGFHIPTSGPQYVLYTYPKCKPIPWTLNPKLYHGIFSTHSLSLPRVSSVRHARLNAPPSQHPGYRFTGLTYLSYNLNS